MTTVMDGLASDELWALVRAVVAGRRDYPAGVAVREPRTSTHRWAMPSRSPRSSIPSLLCASRDDND
jgi:hypothetical protein